jgi:hypothetical protein
LGFINGFQLEKSGVLLDKTSLIDLNVILKALASVICLSMIVFVQIVPYRSTGKDQQVESTVGSHNDAFYLSKYAPSELQISNSKILMNSISV